MHVPFTQITKYTDLEVLMLPQDECHKDKDNGCECGGMIWLSILHNAYSRKVTGFGGMHKLETWNEEDPLQPMQQTSQSHGGI